MDIRALLKKNPLIFNLNASLKARKTTKQTQRLNILYNNKSKQAGLYYDQQLIPAMVKERLARRGILLEKTARNLNIFWVGACESQDQSGFLQGFEKYGQVIPYRNLRGSYGQEFPGKLYDPEFVKKNSEGVWVRINEAIEKYGRVDVLMGQMWANFIEVETLQRIQSLGIPTMNVSMDDRLPCHWEKIDDVLMGAVGLADGLDLVLTSSPECCVRFLIHRCPSIFWPMASDPSLFKPSEIKDIDVTFVGNKYGIRERIIKKFEDKGIKVEAFGGGWPNGPIEAAKIGELFGRSKIILGIGTIGYNEDLFTLKLRDFDATMAGALYVTHRNPDLLKLFEEGKEIECYADDEEALRKITYYLEHSERRETIAQRAAEKSRKHHSWEKRIGEAMKVLGFKVPE